MSVVYNPEADSIARIEALELEARELRRKVEQAHRESDKKVLSKQLDELKDEISFLKAKVDKLAKK